MAAPPYMSKKPKPKDLADPGGFGKKAAGPPPPDTPDPDGDGDNDATGGGGPPGMSGGGGGSMLTLEDIKYHDEPEACALCKHYSEGGMCDVVNQQVNPDGGCCVFSPADQGAGGGQMGQMQQAPMSAGMPMPTGGGGGGAPLPS